jgi:hypothetical protein
VALLAAWLQMMMLLTTALVDAGTGPYNVCPVPIVPFAVTLPKRL